LTEGLDFSKVLIGGGGSGVEYEDEDEDDEDTDKDGIKKKGDQETSHHEPMDIDSPRLNSNTKKVASPFASVRRRPNAVVRD